MALQVSNTAGGTPDTLQEQCIEARGLMRLDELDRASSIAQAVLESCGDQGNSSEAWCLRFIQADVVRLRGKTDQALAYLSERLTLFPPDRTDRISLVGLKKSRGYCFGLLGDYRQSDLLLHEAEREAREAGLTELQCEVQQCLALIYFFREDYVTSDRFFRSILSASSQIGGWYFRANALWGIGKNLMIQGHHQAAIEWLERSLELFNNVGAKLSIARIWSELAVCHLGLGDDQRALALLQKALKINYDAGVRHNYQVGLAVVGNVYLHRGDHLRAIDYYRRALEVAREIKDPVSIAKWSHNIRMAYLRIIESVEQLDSRSA